MSDATRSVAASIDVTPRSRKAAHLERAGYRPCRCARWAHPGIPGPSPSYSSGTTTAARRKRRIWWDEVVACVRVPDGRGGCRQEVRTYPAFTSGLEALAEWLAAEGVTQVGDGGHRATDAWSWGWR
jgi:hypothetical protein